MSDTIMRDESGVRYSYDNIKTQGWLNGHTSGLDAAVSWLKERAIVLFRDGKYDAAISMRKLADDMHAALYEDMEERASRHQDEFPAVVEDEP